jgi:hypothetical protein
MTSQEDEEEVKGDLDNLIRDPNPAQVQRAAQDDNPDGDQDTR